MQNSGDIVLVDKTYNIRVLNRTLKKGDVVVAKSPTNPKETICKRICAVELEKINGQAIPKNHFWLQGDNLNNSSDSRFYGPVSRKLIHGKVLFRIWPPFSIGRLPANPNNVTANNGEEEDGCNK